MPTKADLAERLDRIEASQQQLVEERDRYRRLYEEVMLRCRRLELGLLGQRAERTPNDAQLALDVMGLVIGDEADAVLAEDEEPKPVKGYKRKPQGRQKLPEHLPRVDIELLPEEVRREGLDNFDRIGEEVREIVEHRKAQKVVARICRPKFVRKDANKNRAVETQVCIAPPLALPIGRCLGGPGILAETIVRRWADHCPLNRLERIYAREDLPLARSTICGWHTQLEKVVRPIVDAMRADAFEQPVLCTDATGVLVQAKDRCERGHFWVMVSLERHVLFEFTAKHDTDAVDSILSGYEGMLVADAHAVYDHLFVDGKVDEVNCWAHARRYFFYALDSDPDRAKIGLKYINALFKLERSIAGSPRKKRERIRARRSKPIVEAFFSWCDAEWHNLLESSPMYAAVRYARNQRAGLSKFLRDGRLPIHNNMSELELRRQAVGRKNWLFVGSEKGARANATFTSLIASCAMHKVEPWEYLRDIFILLALGVERPALIRRSVQTAA